ncbi:MAG: hypothetical protein GY853_03255 [PVC group bacterium]|nr:hypothetical protein [PVC group bacterium]
MLKFNKILIVLFCGLLVSSGYIVYRFRATIKEVGELKTYNRTLSKKKDMLEGQLTTEKKNKNVEIEKLKEKLTGLKDTRKIQELFTDAQGKIKNFDAKFQELQKENIYLEQTNRAINGRFNNLTKDFIKTLDILKQTRQHLTEARNSKALRLHEKETKKLNSNLKKKENLVVKLSKDIKRLQKDNDNSSKNNKLLVDEIGKLKKNKQSLELRYEKIREKLKQSEQEIKETSNKFVKEKSVEKKPVRQKDDGLRRQLKELKGELADKEKQQRTLKRFLEQEKQRRKITENKLEQYQKRLKVVSEQTRDDLASARKAIRKYDMVKSERDSLEKALKKAEEEIKEKAEFVKGLEKKVDDINKKLTKREEEKEAMSKDIAKLKKTRIPIGSGLASDMAQIDEGAGVEAPDARKMQDNLNKVYALYDTAKAQVVKFSELLMQKELKLEKSKQKLDSLEQEIKMLRGGVITPGSGEVPGQVAVLNMKKLKIEEKFKYEKQKYEDINELYVNLKSQVVQVTSLLTRRETELEDKTREIINLKRELAKAQQQYSLAQQELNDVRQRQRRTLDDLSRTTRLNATLQENMMYNEHSNDNTRKEQKKAEELKKELEAFLGNRIE